MECLDHVNAGVDGWHPQTRLRVSRGDLLQFSFNALLSRLDSTLPQERQRYISGNNNITKLPIHWATTRNLIKVNNLSILFIIKSSISFLETRGLKDMQSAYNCMQFAYS